MFVPAAARMIEVTLAHASVRLEVKEQARATFLGCSAAGGAMPGRRQATRRALVSVKCMAGGL